MFFADVSLQRRTSPTNLPSHHLHQIRHKKSLVMGEYPQSLANLSCAILLPAEIGM
jgi:hypothetical protein